MAGHAEIGAECLKVLRGRRSQRAFGRLFGYGSNVVYRWEAGLRAPRASEVLSVMQRIGRPVRAGLESADARCEALRGVAVTAEDFVPALLGLFVSGRSVADIAREAKIPRLNVSRALRGETSVRWHTFLHLLDVLTGRLVDFLGHWLDVSAIPSLAARVISTNAWRQAAYGVPWTEGVVALVECDGYQALDAHEPGWIAQRLQIGVEEEEAAIEALVRAGLLVWSRGRLAAGPRREIDTRGDPEAFAGVKRFWVRAAADRTEADPAGLSAYLVACASEEAVQSIQEAYAQAYRHARAVLRQDHGGERVVLLTAALTPLDGEALVSRSQRGGGLVRAPRHRGPRSTQLSPRA